MAEPEQDLDVPEADALYDLDPSEFTAARNALAKQLKADGHKEAAAVVAKLRKPNAVAWALNQVARRNVDLVDAALDAGDALRVATEAAMSGDASGVRDATTADRAATSDMVDAAAEVAGSVSQDVRDRMAATIRAAVLDDGVADQLRRGRLDSDHAATGFGFGPAADPGGPTLRLLQGGKSTKPRPKARQSADERAAAEAAAKAEEAERARRRAQAELDDAATKAEQRAERLAAQAERAEAEAAEHRSAADEAAEAARQARAAADAGP